VPCALCFVPRRRAGLNCRAPGYTPETRAPCSAHCLTFDDIWYAGYALGPPSLQWNITTTVAVPATATADGLPRTESLRMDLSSPLALTTSRLVSTELQGFMGDLLGGMVPPVLTRDTLVTPQEWHDPSVRAANSAGGVSTGADVNALWMLLPGSKMHYQRFNASDRTHTLKCSVVGVDFDAFNSPADKCDSYSSGYAEPGSCLRNQIKDLQEEDTFLTNAGWPNTPQYNIKGMYRLGSAADLGAAFSSLGAGSKVSEEGAVVQLCSYAPCGA
jgi:hypothetical protein